MSLIECKKQRDLTNGEKKKVGAGHNHILCRAYVFRKDGAVMFLGKKGKDVRLTGKEYKNLVGSMSKKERKEFDRRQKEFRRDREDDRLEAWLDFEDDMDDMGW